LSFHVEEALTHQAVFAKGLSPNRPEGGLIHEAFEDVSSHR
jgi:hypothetical protein